MPHAVVFYRDDTALIDAMVGFIQAAYRELATIIVIATEPHRKELRVRFQSLDHAEIEATVLYIDAVDLLSRFMVNGQPDRTRFISALTPFVERATHRGPIRIFGEMVGLLWTQGNTTGALRLEELWTELGARDTFSRVCSYPLSGFPDQHHETYYQVCHTHTRVLHAEQAR
jgi:MEDS: MEthanogen/methylotroph, DcmR Sensory domain